MKAKFEFNLPEEQSEYNLYRQAPDMHCVLYDLANFIRSKRKHTEEEWITYDDLHEEFWNICGQYEIDPYGE